MQLAAWCDGGIVPIQLSAERNFIRQIDALLCTFDITVAPVPTSRVEHSILEQYLRLKRIFVLCTSKKLAPESTEFQSLLPMLKTSFGLGLLKKLISSGNVAGREFLESLLHCAICAKDSSIVASLLQPGFDPNQQVFNLGKKKSLLRLAAEMGDLAVVKLLVDAGADVDGVQPEGHGVASPLIAAVIGNFVDLVKYLVLLGSLVGCKDHWKTYHCSALVAGAAQGNPEMMEILLEAHTHVKDRRFFVNIALSALILSSSVSSDQDEKLESLRMLLAEGADPDLDVHRYRPYRRRHQRYQYEYNPGDDADNDRDLRERTPLELSAKHGHFDYVTTLLEYGAQITARVVLASIRSRHADLALYLLDRIEDGNLSYKSIQEMVREAVDHKEADGQINLLRALLKLGERLNTLRPGDKGNILSRGSDTEADEDHILTDILKNHRDLFKLTPLEIAARRGHVGILNLLLDGQALSEVHGVPHFRPHVSKPTIFDLGAESGKIEILERLLQAGADTHSSKNALVTVILRFQSPEIVWRIIQSGADVNGDDVFSRTPLQAAVRVQNLSITRMLLEALLQNPGIQTGGNQALDSALCEAIESRNEDLINILLQSGAHVSNSATRAKSSTTLAAAVRKEDLNLVLKLLEGGASANDPGALLAATAVKNTAVFLETLLRWPTSARRRSEYGAAALQYAIRTGDCTRVQRLLDAGVRRDIWPTTDDIHPCDKRGLLFNIEHCFTALSSALAFDNSQYGPILHLVITGMDPDAHISWGCSGLQFAAQQNRCDLAEFMIAHGANVNVRILNCIKCGLQSQCEHKLNTPVWIAVASVHTEMLKLLLRHKARVDIEDEDSGRALLELAVSSKNKGIIQILLDAGAQLNTKGSNTMCPALEAAVQSGSMDIVQLLLKHDANASGKSSLAYTSALHYTVQLDDLLMAHTLLEAGANAKVCVSCEEEVDCEFSDDESEEYSDTEHDYDDWPQTITRSDWSVIQYCAATGSVHMAMLLIRYGADVNAQACVEGSYDDDQLFRRMSRQGLWLPPLSPLEEAAKRGHTEMLQLLLDSGAQTRGEGARQYKRALHYARESCSRGAIKLLENCENT